MNAGNDTCCSCLHDLLSHGMVHAGIFICNYKSTLHRERCYNRDLAIGDSLCQQCYHGGAVLGGRVWQEEYEEE